MFGNSIDTLTLYYLTPQSSTIYMHYGSAGDSVCKGYLGVGEWSVQKVLMSNPGDDLQLQLHML